ncbi:MAG: hypothetical protein J0G28_11920 [Afipia sp.]|nr:hypothetical protein [Afipia sp.]
MRINIARRNRHTVMPGLVPGIHALTKVQHNKTWMAGINPAMTIDGFVRQFALR